MVNPPVSNENVLSESAQSNAAQGNPRKISGAAALDALHGNEVQPESLKQAAMYPVQNADSSRVRGEGGGEKPSCSALPRPGFPRMPGCALLRTIFGIGGGGPMAHASRGCRG